MDAVVYVVVVVAASITAAIIAVDYARQTRTRPQWSVSIYSLCYFSFELVFELFRKASSPIILFNTLLVVFIDSQQTMRMIPLNTNKELIYIINLISEA